jgi:hypothetical protein
MSTFFKYLVSAFVISLVAGTASIEAVPPGLMEGHLKIIFHMAVGESSDEMPRAEGAPESYAQYPLVILNQEEKKEIARVTADKGGNYRVALPPGNYVLNVQDLPKQVRAAPRPFTVVSNQTVHVDMIIVSGLGGVGR